LYTVNDSNASPYIQCSQGKSGLICKNIKITKTRCGPNSGDAKEGEIFVTPATENTNTNNYDPSLYYDGNHYSICLDTSTEIPISLRLNYDITSSYMTKKNANNIFGTEDNEYSVISVLQFDVELSSCNYLYIYIYFFLKKKKKK